MDAVKPGPPGQRLTLRAERAHVTRTRIAAAARGLFVQDGYGATTLVAIAAEAGVAVQTVYAVYGSKAGILRALRESVVSQPEADASVRAAIAAPSAGASVDLFARSIRERWGIGGDIVAIHRDAAATDPSIRSEMDAVLAVRRGGITRFAQSLGDRLAPGVDVDRATAIIDALTMPELHAELVGVHGWAADAYESWLAAALRRELLPDTS
jgi:AcrR family transcriptional regulator